MIRKNENALFKIWRVLYPALMYLGVQVLVSIILTFAIAVFEVVRIIIENGEMGLEGLDFSYLIYMIQEKALNYSMFATFLASLIVFPYFLWAFKKRPDERIDKYGLKDMGFSYAALIFTAAIPINILSSFTVSLFSLDKISDSYSIIEEVIRNSPFIPMFLATVIAAPVVEELIFRGLIFNRLNRYLGKGWALVLSSLIFGITHMNIVQGTYAFVVGFLLGYLYLKYKTIWAPIIAHFGFNFTSIMTLALLNNAGELAAGIFSVVSLLISVPVVVLLIYIDFVPKKERIKIS